MPEKYVAIKQKFLKGGMSLANAKTRAAKIFNATRKPGVAPVGPHSDEKLKPPPRKHPKYPR